ncbi:hypothetical protein L596_023340 [Steinernema carpocapsae]|nr:hypothetical protein L596_023340 [Steinernema carpocapsae]
MLIGILSLIDLICVVFELQNAFRILAQFESFRVACFWVFSPYLFFINVQSTVILALALDRLLAMYIPVLYRRISTRTYVLLVLTPCFLCAAAIFVPAVVYLEDERIAACNPPLTYPPLISQIWNRWIIVSDVSTIVIYLATMILLMIKKRHFSKLNRACTEYHFFVQQQHIMRTISVIVIAFACSSFFCHCSVLFVTFLGLSESVVQIFQTIAVIPAIMCYCQNYYIYLWRSAEYRASFKNQFLSIIKCNWQLCVPQHSTVLSVYSSTNHYGH